MSDNIFFLFSHFIITLLSSTHSIRKEMKNENTLSYFFIIFEKANVFKKLR